MLVLIVGVIFGLAIGYFATQNITPSRSESLNMLSRTSHCTWSSWGRCLSDSSLRGFFIWPGPFRRG